MIFGQDCPQSSALTTASLIRAILTVSLPITQEAFWQAAGFVVALVNAVVRFKAVCLVRTILALGDPVTQLTLINALFTMGTLELIYRDKENKMQSQGYHRAGILLNKNGTQFIATTEQYIQFFNFTTLQGIKVTSQ